MVRLPAGSIAIEGPARTGKTRMLVQRTLDLLRVEPSGSILVLCSNYYRKSRFLEQLQDQLQECYAQLPITTYSALVRNTLAMFWPCVEDTLVNKTRLGGRSVIFPELSGFEASEYFVRKIVAQLKQTNPLMFEDLQGSDRSLITQLIRRARLRAENRLSRKEMRLRSELIGESCIDEVEEVLKTFDIWSSKLRVLDNSRQIDAFHSLLQDTPSVQDYFRKNIRHLIVDDVDETIPAQQHFIQFLAPSLDTLAMAADMDGGTRRGYLNAYPYDWEGLKRLKPEMQTIQLPRNDSMYPIAQQLLKNWTQPDPLKQAETLPVSTEIAWRSQSVTRLDMLNQVVSDITQLLQKEPAPGEKIVSPGDLVIVMPRVDPLARMQIQQQLSRRGIPLQILTGTQRPTDNPICRGLLLLLQLVNRISWQMPLSPIEFRGILHYALKLHQVDLDGVEQLLHEYRGFSLQGAASAPLSFLPEGSYLNAMAKERYERLLSWLDRYNEEPIDEQLYSAFSEIISPLLTSDDELSDIQQLIRSLYIERVARMLDDDSENNTLAAKEWLLQVKTGIVADTPNKPHKIDPQAIVLGTPQKVIDFEIERPIHLWLDISSREWSRTDNAPLYNAWVHSVNWDGDTTQASDSFNQLLTRTRAGHITRTLLLYADSQVYLYSSELDDQGNMNTGLFHKMLLLPGGKAQTQVERATLREDQVDVLSYQQGPMAITAVPGAGKTFINVELLLELIERGIPPENILVLTYMESAARTLLSRLKKKLDSHHSALPVISTIHSLAFRMITEDDNALYLGLDPDAIEIIDQLQEPELLQPIIDFVDDGQGFFKKSDAVLKAIHYAKAHRLSPTELKRLCEEKGIPGGRIVKLVAIYEAYEKTLRQQGKLDFTDLIMKAIELLENHPEIRDKYQQRFRYVIEDEAQDSSSLLQHLLRLLTETHQNLVRTGDPNQSIMSFSTAEPSVFRDFINRCRTEGLVVEMDQSSRCSEPVIQLANAFVQWASQDDILKHAFQSATMKPVSGQNPNLLERMECHTFDTLTTEHHWIARHIETLQTAHPDKSIAVLVRGNLDVLNIAKALQSHGLKAISHTDTPALNPVFLLIVNVLKVLEHPADSELLDALCQQLIEFGVLTLSQEEMDEGLHRNLLRMKPADIRNASLLQLYYNLQDLMRYAFGQDICKLIVRITDMFFAEPQQHTMGYLCALKAQDWVNQLAHSGVTSSQSALEWVNYEFKRCVDKRRLPFRSTQDALDLAQSAKNRFVQVMTLHKAKGQEFDFVFIPGMTDTALPSHPSDVIWGDEDKLILEIEKLRTVSPDAMATLMDSMKLKKVEEEARLIYVGLTRARQGLYLSCPLESKDWRGKAKSMTPSRHFMVLQEFVSPIGNPRQESTTHA